MTQEQWQRLKLLNEVRTRKVELLSLARKKNDLVRQVALMEQIDAIDSDINLIMKQGVLITCES